MMPVSAPGRAADALMLLADATLTAALVLAFAWAVNAVARRSAAAVRYGVWAASILGILALPLLVRPLPGLALAAWPARVDAAPTAAPPSTSATTGEHAAPGRSPYGAGAMPIRNAPGSPAAGTSAPPPAPVRSASSMPASHEGAIAATAGPHVPVHATTRGGWTTWILSAWLSGTVLSLLWLAAGLHRARRCAKAATPLDDDPGWSAPCRSLAGQVGIKPGVAAGLTLLRSRDISTPMTFGARRPVILLPAGAGSWSPARRRVVLAHELVHVRRRDWALQVLVQVIRALYWYHPMVWIAAARLAIEREKACDEAVVALGTRPSEYARHLLAVACARRTGAVAPAGTLAMAHRTQLEGRLMSILTRTPAPTRRGLAAAGPLALLVVVLASPLAMLRIWSHPALPAAGIDPAPAVVVEVRPDTDPPDAADDRDPPASREERLERRIRRLVERLLEREIDADDRSDRADRADRSDRDDRKDRARRRKPEPRDGPFDQLLERLHDLEAIERAAEPFDHDHPELDRAMEKLHEKLAPLHRKLEGFHGRLEPLHRELERLHEHLEPLHRELEPLHEKLQPLERKMTRLHERLGRPGRGGGLDGRLERLADRLRPLRDRLEDLDRRGHDPDVADVLRDALGPIERELERLRDDLGRPHDHAEPGRGDDHGPLHEEIMRLHEHMEPLHREMGRIHERMAPVHEEMQKLQERMQPILESMEPIHESMEPLHEELSRLGRKMAPLQRRLERLHERRLPFDVDLDRLDGQLEGRLAPLLERDVVRVQERIEAIIEAVIEEIEAVEPEDEPGGRDVRRAIERAVRRALRDGLEGTRRDGDRRDRDRRDRDPDRDRLR